MSHAGKADKLLIKPTAGARPASPCTPGRFIRKAHNRGLTPEESRTTRTTPPWQRPLTDRPSDSHRRLSPDLGIVDAMTEPPQELDGARVRSSRRLAVVVLV